MGAIGRLFAISSTDMQNPANWLTEWAGGRQTTAGININESKAMGISAVFACVRNLAEDEAKLPLPIYEELKDGSREKLKKHPGYAILNYASNPEMTAFNARQAITACAILYGAGYAEIVRDGRGNILELWPLAPARVTPKRDPKDNTLFYEIRKENGTFDKILMPRDVFELPGFGMNGIVGEMIASTGKESLGLCLAAEQFASSFFGNGINTGGILSHPGSPKKERREVIRKSFGKVHKGPSSGNKLMLVWDGMTFTPTTVDPNKAQAVESRQFQVEEVSRWFRMPPDKIGHLIRTKGWNTQETANIAYLTDTLLAWFVRWEQEIKRKIIRPSERATMYAEHLVDALLRVDVKTRAIVHQTEFRNGALSVDDWAKLENKKPLGGEIGKKRWVMANMVPMDTQATPQVESKSSKHVDGDASVVAAVRPVLVEAATRLSNREALATKRAAKKHEGDSEAFEKWIYKFADEQRPRVADCMNPGIESLAILLSGDSKGVVESYASAHVNGFIEHVITAFKAHNIESFCETWIEERPDEIADYLIGKLHG